MTFFHFPWQSVCDGVDGTVKCLAARAIMQRPYIYQIMIPYQLSQWASKSVYMYLELRTCYCNREEYEEQNYSRGNFVSVFCDILFVPISQDASYCNHTGTQCINNS